MGGDLLFRVRGTERRPVHGVDGVMDAIVAEATWQRDSPPSGDQVIGAMWDGFLYEVENDPLFREFVEQFAAKQSVIIEPWTVGGVPRSEVNGLLRTAIQFDSIRNGLHFPQTRRGWIRQLNGMVTNPTRRAVVEMLLDHFHTMTTSGDRYGPFEVVRQLKGLPAGFLDAASSIGIGARQTQLKEYHPFWPVRFELPDGSEDSLASQGYANLIGAPALRGRVMLADLVSPNDRLGRRVSLASNRPSEIIDHGFREKRRALVRTKLSNLAFEECDLTKRSTMGGIREYCAEHDVRVAMIATVLNQIGQEHVGTVIDNVLWALPDHPDSEAVVAEFAQVDRRDRSQLSLLPEWGRSQYSYFGVRKADRGNISNLFHFTSSRPRVGRVGDGVVAVQGETPYIRDALVARAAGAASLRERVPSPSVLSMLA